MAISYGFFNSSNYDRLYDAVDISKFFDGLVTNGVYSSVGEGFLVRSASGSKYTDPCPFTVGSGRAWFDHTWVESTDALEMSTVISAVVNKRVDAVVLYTDSKAREAGIEVIRGTDSASYTYPTLPDTASRKHHVLAYLKFANDGRPYLDTVEIKVGTDACPWVTGVLSNSDQDIFAYIQQQWNQFIAAKNAEWNQFPEQIEEWEDTEKERVDDSIENSQDAFDEWFTELQNMLNNDPAIAIANQITQMKANFVNKNIIVQENTNDASKIPSAKVLYDLSQQVGPIVVTPTWADGTDEEIVTALQKAYAGEIDLEEDYGWAVGDERPVHLSAMTWNYTMDIGEERQFTDEIPAEDKTLVLIDTDHFDLASGGKCKFVVALKEAACPRGVNLSDGSWDKSDNTGPEWNDQHNQFYRFLNEYYNRFPAYIQGILKTFRYPFIPQAYTDYISGPKYYTSKLTVPSAIEMFGKESSFLDRIAFVYTSGKYYSPFETLYEISPSNMKPYYLDGYQYMSQLEYYKTTVNRQINSPDTTFSDAIALRSVSSENDWNYYGPCYGCHNKGYEPDLFGNYHIIMRDQLIVMGVI